MVSCVNSIFFLFLIWTIFIVTKHKMTILPVHLPIYIFIIVFYICYMITIIKLLKLIFTPPNIQHYRPPQKACNNTISKFTPQKFFIFKVIITYTQTTISLMPRSNLQQNIQEHPLQDI